MFHSINACTPAKTHEILLSLYYFLFSGKNSRKHAATIFFTLLTNDTFPHPYKNIILCFDVPLYCIYYIHPLCNSKLNDFPVYLLSRTTAGSQPHAPQIPRPLRVPHHCHVWAHMFPKHRSLILF